MRAFLFWAALLGSAGRYIITRRQPAESELNATVRTQHVDVGACTERKRHSETVY